ncbi:SIS domain-containing protein [Candidatus Acetothermia bacterium]|nr:SIS domain-containing protein [Candidatus Acetothermia bacterium]
MSLKSEIFEQPAILTRLIKNQLNEVQKIARGAIRAQNVNFAYLAARGSSDNAGLYAKYLWGAYNRLPVALAAPALFSRYERPPNLQNALVVGISQSGQSPDIISVITEGRKQGALTLAITNDLQSPLALAAEFTINTSAGPEEAIAATKTYTAQLMSIAMFSAALSNDQNRLAALSDVPALVQETLLLDGVIKQVIERYRDVHQCIVLGRGYNYATAFEWSLKLKELSYVIAAPYSTSDFLHGPLALLSPGFLILAIVPTGVVFADIFKLLSDIVKRYTVQLVAVSNDERVLALAHTPLRLPAKLPEWLSPLVSIVLAQLFSYYLTRARGYDPESPRGLTKVTRTW